MLQNSRSRKRAQSLLPRCTRPSATKMAVVRYVAYKHAPTILQYSSPAGASSNVSHIGYTIRVETLEHGLLSIGCAVTARGREVARTHGAPGLIHAAYLEPASRTGTMYRLCERVLPHGDSAIHPSPACTRCRHGM